MVVGNVGRKLFWSQADRTCPLLVHRGPSLLSHLHYGCDADRSTDYQVENAHPSARAITPATIPPAASTRRLEFPSDSSFAPITVPTRMLISLAGAT